ncbi:MAG: MarR family winged helix-turn-helix transcriptional regulator [Gammaproteobacteria bacterium]|nr:MarR family winged helix-turn-helix transcriptional regulator [Gammaproteobacteria bacterium]MBU2408898.1 MarR family winged helix-turn-helix transcriptional regulator [Gammaproteobacteria bacterium]
MQTAEKPKGCTNFHLRRLLRQVSRLYDAEVGKSGLKTTQYSLLSHVLNLGPLRPSDLAQAMGLDASTLTRNLKPLIASGWLVQVEGVDARSRLISITETGRKKRSEAQRHWHAAQKQLNELLGVDRVMSLHALLDESFALMQQAGEGVEGEDDE